MLDYNQTRKFLKSYLPSYFITGIRSLLPLYMKLQHKLSRIQVNEKSKIYDMLIESWEDYRYDLYPKDRRMSILRERDVAGMSTENIQFFLNEIVGKFAKNGTYLEIGTFQGGSLLSAALFNSSTRCIGVDNFSEFNSDKKNEPILKENLKKFDNPKNIEFFNMDYKEALNVLFSKEPDLKIDVYYYDGPHTYEHQIGGLEAILPYLSEKCVILVDDINWISVDRANEDFVRRHHGFKYAFKIRTKMDRAEDWWNGFSVITKGL